MHRSKGGFQLSEMMIFNSEKSISQNTKVLKYKQMIIFFNLYSE